MTRQYILDDGFSFSLGSSDEAEVDAKVTFAYTPGAPDTYDASRGGPGGWDPGYPPEVDIVSIEIRDGERWVTLPECMVEALAHDDDLYTACCEKAAQDAEDDFDARADYEYEKRRDREADARA
jgi:hypothetical protein